MRRFLLVCALVLIAFFAGSLLLPEKNQAAVAAGASETAAPADSGKSPKPAHVSHGQPIKLEDYLVAGKTVVFDFTSEYCPPCRAIAPKLDQLHARRADIVVVKVDINRPDVKGIDWRSPVARQFQLQSIPHFKVYGPDGKLQVEGDDAYGLVSSWLN